MKQKQRIGSKEIRKKYEHYGPTDSLSCNDCAVLHIRFLLEEIDRLDSELFELEETYK